MRILIVEDEPNLGRQLKSTLEQTGYAVDLAADGEEGHFLGATENYDAVILDLGLPEIDGLTVLDRWRKEGRTTPVLVLTARDSWSDKVAGLDAGADDYLAKPFQTQELIARLRALIRRASGNASSELTAGDVRLDTRSGRVTLTDTTRRGRLNKGEDKPLHRCLLLHLGRLQGNVAGVPIDLTAPLPDDFATVVKRLGKSA